MSKLWSNVHFWVDCPVKCSHSDLIVCSIWFQRIIVIHNKHRKENPFLAVISHIQPHKSKSFKAAQQHLSEMKNKERRMKWSVYSEQTNPFSASANIDYRDLKHLKDLLKQTLTRKEGEWPGVSTGQVVLDWRLFAWAAIIIIRLLRLEVLHHSAQRAYKPNTRMSVCKIYVVWFNFQIPTLKGDVRNFYATSLTKQNLKNSDCFQTYFLKTLPICH